MNYEFKLLKIFQTIYIFIMKSSNKNAIIYIYTLILLFVLFLLPSSIDFPFYVLLYSVSHGRVLALDHDVFLGSWVSQGTSWFVSGLERNNVATLRVVREREKDCRQLNIVKK